MLCVLVHLHFSGQRGSITIIRTAIIYCISKRSVADPWTLSKGLWSRNYFHNNTKTNCTSGTEARWVHLAPLSRGLGTRQSQEVVTVIFHHHVPAVKKRPLKDVLHEAGLHKINTSFVKSWHFSTCLPVWQNEKYT